MDWAQKLWSCCGKRGPSDFNSTATCGVGRAVESCHKGNTCAGALYEVGCKTKLSDLVAENLHVIGAVLQQIKLKNI